MSDYTPEERAVAADYCRFRADENDDGPNSTLRHIAAQHESMVPWSVIEKLIYEIGFEHPGMEMEKDDDCRICGQMEVVKNWRPTR